MEEQESWGDFIGGKILNKDFKFFSYFKKDISLKKF